MSRALAVCADDFGVAANVTEAVLALGAAGRLNAVSCLVNGATWRSDAPALRGLDGRLDAGLHFNLSEGRPLSAALARHWARLPSLPRLLAQAHLGRLPLAAIGTELEAQLDAFATALGRPPAYLDGHQHVHHLPGVRELICAAVARLRPAPAVRNTGTVIGPGQAFKRAVIAGSGGRALQRLLEARGIAHNAALTGVYGFDAPSYRRRMQGWLGAVPAAGALLFCHPGARRAAAADDPIAAARVREFDYLRSDDFAADLAAADIELGRVWRVAPRR